MARVRYISHGHKQVKGKRHHCEPANTSRRYGAKLPGRVNKSDRHDSAQDDNARREQQQKRLDQIQPHDLATGDDDRHRIAETSSTLYKTRETRPEKQPASYEEFTTICKDVLHAWDLRLSQTLRHVATWYVEGKPKQAGAKGSWQRPGEGLLDAASKVERCMWEIARDLHVELGWVERRFAGCKKLCVRCQDANTVMMSREVNVGGVWAGEHGSRITDCWLDVSSVHDEDSALLVSRC